MKLDTFEKVKDGSFVGLPTGQVDVNGDEVHFGDTLAFDEKEWGSSNN